MSDGGYKGGGPTREGLWGTVIGVVAATPIFFILLIGNTLGDCVDGVECKRSAFVNVFLPTLALGSGAGAIAWFIAKLIRKNGT